MASQGSDELIGKYMVDGQQSNTKPLGVLQIAIYVFAIAMILFQFFGDSVMSMSELAFKDIHYAFVLTISFLVLMKKHPKQNWLWAILLVVSLFSTGYVYFYEEALILRAGQPIGLDIPVGIALLVVALIATWRTWGMAIPLMSLAFIGYTFIIQYLPPPFYGPSPTLARMVTTLTIGLTGMWGTMMSTSANTIFYFMVFGSVFEMTGTVRWFDEIGKVIGRFSKAGAAQTSVVTSALFGLTSGSAMANVVTSGIFTIPAMKKAGFKPEDAAAIEATSSVGGQIMPPIMGTTAFIMAAVIATPYAEIALRAAIPALLFFLACGVQVELIARKERTTVADEQVNVKELILMSPLFIVPMVLLTWLLFEGHSVAYSTGPAILSMIVISMLRKETRPTWRGALEGLSDGAIKGAELGITCAAMAPIVVLTTYTGLGIKFPGIVQMFSGGNMLIALILTAIVALVVGLGAPTSVTYLIVAIIIAPGLVKMGVPLLAAHMFAFYYGIIGAVSPPVAPAVLVAARMGDADYMKAGWASMKFAVVGFIVPFLFCFNPVLLGYFKDPVSDIVVLVMTCVLVFILSVALVGWYLTRLNVIETLVAGLSSALLAFYIGTNNLVLLVAALVSFGLLTLWQVKKKRAEKNLQAGASPA